MCDLVLLMPPRARVWLGVKAQPKRAICQQDWKTPRSEDWGAPLCVLRCRANANANPIEVRVQWLAEGAEVPVVWDGLTAFQCLSAGTLYVLYHAGHTM